MSPFIRGCTACRRVKTTRSPWEPVIVGILEGTARSHIVLSALPRDQRCGDYFRCRGPLSGQSGMLGRVLINAQVAAPHLLHPPYTSKKDTLQAIDEGTLYKQRWWRVQWFVTEGLTMKNRILVAGASVSWVALIALVCSGPQTLADTVLDQQYALHDENDGADFFINPPSGINSFTNSGSDDDFQTFVTTAVPGPIAIPRRHWV